MIQPTTHHRPAANEPGPSLPDKYPQRVSSSRGLRLPAVMDMTGLGRSAIYEKIRQGFPKPAKCGRVSIWRESEVQAWLDGQFAHRDSKGGTQ